MQCLCMRVHVLHIHARAHVSALKSNLGKWHFWRIKRLSLPASKAQHKGSQTLSHSARQPVVQPDTSPRSRRAGREAREAGRDAVCPDADGFCLCVWVCVWRGDVGRGAGGCMHVCLSVNLPSSSKGQRVIKYTREINRPALWGILKMPYVLRSCCSSPPLPWGGYRPQS